MNKKAVVPIIVLLVGVLLIGGIIYIVANRTTNQPVQPVGAPVQTEQEITQTEQSVADFEAVKQAFISKKYENTITLAKKFGENNTAGTSEKMNAYTYCLKASYELKNTEASNLCETALRNLTNGMEEDGKTLWNSIIEAAKQGINPGDGSDGEREL